MTSIGPKKTEKKLVKKQRTTRRVECCVADLKLLSSRVASFILGWRLDSTYCLNQLYAWCIQAKFTDHNINITYHISYISYIHIYIHSYIHTCIHSYIPRYIPRYIHAYIHTYIHSYIPTYIPRYIHTYIHPYIHTYIHTYLDTYIHPYMHAYMHTYLHTYIPTYLPTYKYMHTYIPTYIHTNIHTYMHAYIDTHIRTYVHTHMQYIHIYIWFSCILCADVKAITVGKWHRIQLIEFVYLLCLCPSLIQYHKVHTECGGSFWQHSGCRSWTKILSRTLYESVLRTFLELQLQCWRGRLRLSQHGLTAESKISC